MSARGGRYERSMGGMVGAMLVVVLAVVGFAVLRGLSREAPEVRPEAVDYLAAVEQVRTTGLRPVHPADLPQGWIATSVHTGGGDRPEWGMGVLTDEGSFVGVRQEDVDVETLVRTYVDEEATREGEVELEGPLPGPWQSWRDDGGDLGFTQDLRDEGLLVYGSASRQDIETFVASLTR